MQLEGSCHCSSVKFSVWSASPVPFMRCLAGDLRFDGYPDVSLTQWHGRRGLTSRAGAPAGKARDQA